MRASLVLPIACLTVSVAPGQAIAAVDASSSLSVTNLLQISAEPSRSRVALPGSRPVSTPKPTQDPQTSGRRQGSQAQGQRPADPNRGGTEPRARTRSAQGTAASRQAPSSRRPATQTPQSSGQRSSAGASGSTTGQARAQGQVRVRDGIILDRSQPPPPVEPPGEGRPDPSEQDETDFKAPGKSERVRKVPLRRHGFGLKSGIVAVPSFFFSTGFASHSTAHCRRGISGSESARGLTRAEGCNWYLGGEYVFRRTHAFDIITTLAYQQRKLPDGLWINRDDWQSGCDVDLGGPPCDLAMAEYAEIDLSFIQLGVDFVGRATVINTKNFDLQLGGGAGIYAAIFTGRGIYRTPIGRLNDTGRPGSPADPESCRTIDDLGDVTRCTPRWWDDGGVNQDGVGDVTDEVPPKQSTTGPGLFATCSSGRCHEPDLQSFGTRAKTKVPPILPLPKLLVSVRMIFADAFAFNVDAGFDLGFHVGASIQHFFDPGAARKDPARTQARRRAYRSRRRMTAMR